MAPPSDKDRSPEQKCTYYEHCGLSSVDKLPHTAACPRQFKLSTAASRESLRALGSTQDLTEVRTLQLMKTTAMILSAACPLPGGVLRASSRLPECVPPGQPEEGSPAAGGLQWPGQHPHHTQCQPTGAQGTGGCSIGACLEAYTSSLKDGVRVTPLCSSSSCCCP